MRVVAVLVLAVFTGCNANLLYADEPKPQMEQLKDTLWGYVAQVKRTADETFDMIRESEMGVKVRNGLIEGVDAANQYAVYLQKMAPLTQELMAKVIKDMEGLRERLQQDLTTVKEKLEPYTEDVRAQVLQRVEKLKDAVAPYAEDLKSKLDPYAQDVKAQLNSLYESITNTF